MNDKQQPILGAEKLEQISAKSNANVETQTKPKKKSKLKFHFFLTLILGLGTWAFITYSPIAQQWKADWYDFTHQSRGDETPAPMTPTYTEPEPVYQEPAPTVADNTPIFEATPELEKADPPTEINSESLAGLTEMIAALQHQLTNMQENMNQMYAQQMQQGKQQVSAQLSTLLHKASSPNSSIEDVATAWESISLLPMLDEDRRMQAEQAWQDLQGLNTDVQAMADDIITNLRALADKLHPDALADIAESVDNLVDEYANTDTFSTWLDWLKEQFKVSKVDNHALTISQDPYADLKALMLELNQFNRNLRSGQWQQLPDLNNINHQLEQYGLNPTLSPEMVEQLKQTQDTWQQEAQAWMEQL